jgi:hypothetical protein
VLVGTMGVLLVTDLAGGLLEIAAGRNTVGTAWGSEATLCAPYPMILVQVLAVIVITRSSRIPGRVAAVLLALACFVSFLSGFFDGQLGRTDLGTPDLAFQWWLLGVTALLGCLAALSLFRYRTDGGTGQQTSVTWASRSSGSPVGG